MERQLILSFQHVTEGVRVAGRFARYWRHATVRACRGTGRPRHRWACGHRGLASCFPAPGKPALATVAALALLAGCGGGGGDNGSSSGGSGSVSFSVSPSEVTGEAEMGEQAVSGATVTIRNSGSSSINASVQADAGWVGVSPASVSVAANGEGTFSVDATCEGPGVNDATITVAAGGVERRVAVRLDCSAPDVEIDITDPPSFDDGGPMDPPDGFLSFTLRSDWQNPPTLNYSVAVDDGIVLTNPTSGKARVGEPVEVALAVSRCAAPERFEFEITVTAEHAQDPATTRWLADCHAGNPQVTRIETYQGPLIERWDVQDGKADNHDGRNVDALRGRFAALAVVFEHGTPTIPEIQARLVSGSPPRPLPNGSLEKVVAERTVFYPQDFSLEVFESEVVFHVPGEHFRSGVGMEITVDPGERLPEAIESDNVTVHNFLDDMVRAHPIDVRVMAFHRRPAEGENEENPDAVERGLIVPTLAAPEQYARRIEDYMPVTDGVEDRLSILGSIESILGGEYFDWVDALQEVEWNRTRFAENLHEHWIAVVRQPPEQDAFCGVAFVGGYSSVVAEFDSSCGHRAVAHELGHNFGLRHADGMCGSENHDLRYPYAEAALGPNRVWWRGQSKFVHGPPPAPDDGGGDGDGTAIDPPPGDDGETYKDIMSYCRPSFTSDYSYDKALNWREENQPPVAAKATGAAVGKLRGGVAPPGGPASEAPGEATPAHVRKRADDQRSVDASAFRSLALMGSVAADGVHWTLDRAARVAAPALSAEFNESGKPAAASGRHELIVYDTNGLVIDRRAVVANVEQHSGHIGWSARAALPRAPGMVEIRNADGRIVLQAAVNDVPVSVRPAIPTDAATKK